MNQLKNKYKLYFKRRDFLTSLAVGMFLIVGSFFVNYYAGTYATEKASNSVTDIILSNTRVYNLDEIFIYGPIFLWAVVAFFCLKEPQRIPFVLKSLALFIVIRSVFISITHIGPFPDQMSYVVNVPHWLQNVMFGGDLFFSAHTGAPFLMALVFWKNTNLRLFFLFASVCFGVVVLLAHLHYSIDVLSAFFITYTIFQIAKYFFKKDYVTFFHSG